MTDFAGTVILDMSAARNWLVENGQPVIAELVNRCTGLSHMRSGSDEAFYAMVEHALMRSPGGGVRLANYVEED
jgi:hypothetical protein